VLAGGALAGPAAAGRPGVPVDANVAADGGGAPAHPLPAAVASPAPDPPAATTATSAPPVRCEAPA